MTEQEQAALIYVVLAYVEQIRDGKPLPTLGEIQVLLQKFGT
jgi:hypothetical protein